MTSERIKALQGRLPEATVKVMKTHIDMLPYLDESEAFVFWLAVSIAFIDGKQNQLDTDVRIIAAKLNASKQGGAR